MAERLAEGSIIGDAYRIVRPLSAGGMGAVYVAEQLSTGKLRALKLMHHRLQADAKLRERFVKEARVAASIGSAHVVEVIGAGVEADSGTPWLAMELLEGEDLGEHVETHGALSLARTGELMEQICHAVGEAHDAGIVHRDLKPENVFIAHTRAAGQATTVKVLDFGIAKIVAEAQTMGTAALGSPAWMAPEQAEAGGAVTPATDVWALGLITFFTLTGCSYWRAASMPSPSVPAFLKEILFEALPAASKRAAELRCVERLPEGFDEWFDRCVHREPEARFQSARELFAAFRPMVDRKGGTIPIVEAPTGGTFEPVVPMSTRSFLSAGALDTVLVPAEPPPDKPEKPEKPEKLEKEPPPATQLVETAPVEPPARLPAPAPLPQIDARPRASWFLWRLLLVGVGGLFGFLLWLWLGKSDPLPPADAGPAPPSAELPVEAPAVAEAPSVSVTDTTASPIASSSQAARSKSAPSAAPEPDHPPFNKFLAENAVQQRAKFAVQSCSGRDGPRSLPLTVVFKNEGGVKSVEMSNDLRFKGSGMCVSQTMSFIFIPAFSGPEGRVSTTVTLP